MIKNGTNKGEPVIFAGSDSLLNETDHQQYPDLQMLPMIAGSVVLSYNLPKINGRLFLSRDQLVGIYNGTITMWNDASLQAMNPGINLPAQKIIVIARMDKSGTTEIFTSALSAISPEWNATYGTFSQGVDSDLVPVHWNASVVDYFGYQGRGASGLILSFPYSIGYMSLADAVDSDMQYAYLVNKAGNIIEPTMQSVQSAMDDFIGSFNKYFTASIIDAPGDYSYPIAAYSYFIVYKTGMKDCDAAIELVRFIEWAFNDEFARRICEKHHMVCLSKQVVAKVFNDVLKTLTCGDGTNVDKAVEDQRYWEKLSQETWRIPTYVGVPLTLIFIILLSFGISYQQFKRYRRILKGEWKLNLSELVLLNAGDRTKSSQSVMSSNTMDARHTVRWAFSSKMKVAILDDVKLMLHAMENIPHESIRYTTMFEILRMKDTIKDTNICSFYGLAVIEDTYYLAREFCAKGILQEVLQDDNFQLDINFKYSMAIDVCQGMVYLEKKGIVHGFLTSHCCYLDGRWNVKISDWEISKLQSIQLYNLAQDVKLYEPENYADLFWTAPEVLTSRENITWHSDVYSFAIIAYEIFTRAGPYDDHLDILRASEIVQRVMSESLRPRLSGQIDVPNDLHPILKRLWSKKLEERPNFSATMKLLSKTRKTRKCVLDCMMDAMAGYMNSLEEKVNDRTKELEGAMMRVKTVLHQILPPAVAEKLSNGEAVAPEYFDSVTIMFSDIVGFTTIASLLTPLEVVDFLNSLYLTFDLIIDKYDVYKVETIGDAYMVISGLPHKNGIEHAQNIANMALDFVNAMSGARIFNMPKRPVELRAGFHSGPVTAGVVGMKMPRYCLFGDTVNVASRMESTSVPMKIQITASSHKLLVQIGGFVMQERGQTEIKGKGKMTTYWLLQRITQNSKDGDCVFVSVRESQKCEGPLMSV
ncbi:retinal guanylyl cyclase 1-like isoform X2 [Lineus longissimus]